jgi:hypothetical protein
MVSKNDEDRGHSPAARTELACGDVPAVRHLSEAAEFDLEVSCRCRRRVVIDGIAKRGSEV